MCCAIDAPATIGFCAGAFCHLLEDGQPRPLSHPPKIAVVFHGPAVNLISTSRDGFAAADIKAPGEFAQPIRQMKKDSVSLGACDWPG
jgi:intracellular sulfur oxidation DsrE/DsrF family protein